MNGKFTVETFAAKKGLSRQSTINLLSKLKAQGYATVTGGGKQKRIYTISNKKIRTPNGFYYILNKYTKDQIQPPFEHYVYGRYTIEQAIIDGIQLKPDVRTKDAMLNLFRHITNWKLLFDLAKKNDVTQEVHKLYLNAREKTRCKKMPERYAK